MRFKFSDSTCLRRFQTLSVGQIQAPTCVSTDLFTFSRQFCSLPVPTAKAETQLLPVRVCHSPYTEGMTLWGPALPSGLILDNPSGCFFFLCGMSYRCLPCDEIP